MDGQIIRFRGFEIDLRAFAITRNGVAVPIERRVFDLVVYLIGHRDRVVGKDELLSGVWQQARLSDSAIARCVSSARKAFEDPECIQATYGRGYRWMVPVSTGADAVETDARPAPIFSGIFGRGHELKLIGTLVERAAAGEGGTCLVSGEAGIGKTRILGAARDLARRHGMRALVGRSRDADSVPPYWPWPAIVRQLFDDGRHLPEAVSLLLSPALEAPATKDSRVLLWEAVAECIREKARETPTAILIDDLHQADVGSLSLFEFVAEHANEAPLLLGAAYRSADLERDPVRKPALERTAEAGHRASLSPSIAPNTATASTARAWASTSPTKTTWSKLTPTPSPMASTPPWLPATSHSSPSGTPTKPASKPSNSCAAAPPRFPRSPSANPSPLRTQATTARPKSSRSWTPCGKTAAKERSSASPTVSVVLTSVWESAFQTAANNGKDFKGKRDRKALRKIYRDPKFLESKLIEEFTKEDLG